VLEVRVIATEGGLYLLARDESGRVRERIVPDATSAAVLVASWAADDTPVIPTMNAKVAESFGPGTVQTPVALAPASLATTAPAETSSARPSLLIGGTFTTNRDNHGYGLRAELDLVTYGNWTLGIAAAMGRGSMNHVSMNHVLNTWSEADYRLDTTDYSALAYIGRNIELGRWRLRPTFGLGAIRTTAHSEAGDEIARDVSRTFELSVTLAREIGWGWAIAASTDIGLVPQKIDIWMSGNTTFFLERGSQLMFLTGLQRRL
jgi:hypothetical protein